jgi:hypothetical protein
MRAFVLLAWLAAADAQERKGHFQQLKDHLQSPTTGAPALSPLEVLAQRMAPSSLLEEHQRQLQQTFQGKYPSPDYRTLPTTTPAPVQDSEGENAVKTGNGMNGGWDQGQGVGVLEDYSLPCGHMGRPVWENCKDADASGNNWGGSVAAGEEWHPFGPKDNRRRRLAQPGSIADKMTANRRRGGRPNANGYDSVTVQWWNVDGSDRNRPIMFGNSFDAKKKFGMDTDGFRKKDEAMSNAFKNNMNYFLSYAQSMKSKTPEQLDKEEKEARKKQGEEKREALKKGAILKAIEKRDKVKARANKKDLPTLGKVAEDGSIAAFGVDTDQRGWLKEFKKRVDSEHRLINREIDAKLVITPDVGDGEDDDIAGADMTHESGSAAETAHNAETSRASDKQAEYDSAHSNSQAPEGLGHKTASTNKYFAPLEANVARPGVMKNIADWTEAASEIDVLNQEVAANISGMSTTSVSKVAAEALENITKTHLDMRANHSNVSSVRRDELTRQWEPLERAVLQQKNEGESKLQEFIEGVESDVYNTDQLLETDETNMRNQLDATRQGMTSMWNGRMVASNSAKNELDQTFQTTQAHETALLKNIEEYQFYLSKEKTEMLEQRQAILDGFVTKLRDVKKKVNAEVTELDEQESQGNRRYTKQTMKQWKIMDNDKNRAFVGANEERKVEEESLLSKFDEERMAVQRLMANAQKVDTRRNELSNVGGDVLSHAQAEALALQEKVKAEYAKDKSAMAKTLGSLKEQMWAKSASIEQVAKQGTTQENEEIRLKTRDEFKNMAKFEQAMTDLHDEKGVLFDKELAKAQEAKDVQGQLLKEQIVDPLERLDDDLKSGGEEGRVAEEASELERRQRGLTDTNLDTILTHDALPAITDAYGVGKANYEHYHAEMDKAEKRLTDATEDDVHSTGQMGKTLMKQVDDRMKESTHTGDFAGVANELDAAAQRINQIDLYEIPGVRHAVSAKVLPIQETSAAYQKQYTKFGEDKMADVATKSSKAVQDFQRDKRAYAGESDDADGLSMRTEQVFDQSDHQYKLALGAMETTAAKVDKKEREQLPAIRGVEDNYASDKSAAASEMDSAVMQMSQLNAKAERVESMLDSEALEPIQQAGTRITDATPDEFQRKLDAYKDKVRDEQDGAVEKLEAITKGNVAHSAEKGDELRNAIKQQKGSLSTVEGTLDAAHSSADAAALGDSTMASKLFKQFDRVNAKFGDYEEEERDAMRAAKSEADQAEDAADEHVNSLFAKAEETDPEVDATKVYEQALALAMQEGKDAADGADLTGAQQSAQKTLDDAERLKNQATTKVKDMEAKEKAEQAQVDAAGTAAAADTSETQANDGKVAAVGMQATSEIGEGLTEFEQLHRALELARSAVGGLEEKTEDRWRHGKAAAGESVKQWLHDGNGPKTRKLMDDVKMNEIRERQSTQTFSEGVETLRHALQHNRDEVEVLKGRVQSSLASEGEELKESSQQVEDAAAARATAMVGELKGRAHGLAELVDLSEKEHQAEKTEWARYAKLSEKALESAGDHEMHEASALETDMNRLDLQHAQVDRAVHIYREKDLAWKNVVYDKLDSMGVKMNRDGLDLIEGARKAHAAALGYNEKLGGALADGVEGEHAQLERDLARLYIEKDKQINAIMADESLSEEEKKRLIAEIESQAKADADALHKKAADSALKEKQLEQELGKYQQMVDAAAAATARAIANGNLSPSAAHVQKNLAKVGKEVLKLKAKPWLMSLAEVKTSAKARGHAAAMRHLLSSSNHQLLLANAAMKMELSQLEAKIAHLERH